MLSSLTSSASIHGVDGVVRGASRARGRSASSWTEAGQQLFRRHWELLIPCSYMHIQPFPFSTKLDLYHFYIFKE